MFKYGAKTDVNTAENILFKTIHLRLAFTRDAFSDAEESKRNKIVKLTGKN